MKSKSGLTGLWYEDEEVYFFRNYVQSAYYLEWGAKLVDLFTDSNHKLVFVFLKEDHARLKDRWINNKDKDEE